MICYHCNYNKVYAKWMLNIYFYTISVIRVCVKFQVDLKTWTYHSFYHSQVGLYLKTTVGSRNIDTNSDCWKCVRKEALKTSNLNPALYLAWHTCKETDKLAFCPLASTWYICHHASFIKTVTIWFSGGGGDYGFLGKKFVSSFWRNNIRKSDAM